jgi:hypothetical protein
LRQSGYERGKETITEGKSLIPAGVFQEETEGRTAYTIKGALRCFLFSLVGVYFTVKSPCHKSTDSGVIVAKAGAYASN